MEETLARIRDLGIVPVAKLETAEQALPLGRALAAGDLPVVEITFRSDAAEESIRRLRSSNPDLLVGAGTVRTVEQAQQAIGAGAQFVVTPGLNANVVGACQSGGVPVIPGIDSAGQLDLALELGLRVVKFFPAEASGGPQWIRAVAGPFPEARFMATGGITDKNMNTYLELPQVDAVGGSWMVRPELLAAEDWNEVSRLAREAVLAMLGFRFLHLGVNEASQPKALESVKAFTDLFGFPSREGPLSYFLDPSIEILKQPVRGSHGHIAIQTSSVTRAVAYLGRRGFETDQKTATFTAGELTFIYLHREISGFAIHLIRR